MPPTSRTIPAIRLFLRRERSPDAERFLADGRVLAEGLEVGFHRLGGARRGPAPADGNGGGIPETRRRR